MLWLQNIVIISVSFLLSRILIEADAHRYFIAYLLKKGYKQISDLITAVLLLSYLMSLFFSNTVVVLSLIAIINYFLDEIKDKRRRTLVSTYLVLALIYGANIGGMGSLIGSALNIFYLGLLEFYNITGREYINFFSWLLVGIPVSLVLLFIGRLILKIDERRHLPDETIPFHPDLQISFNSKKYITFYFANLFIIIFLSALQFLFIPPPLWAGLNFVDWIFVFYFAGFMFFAFIYPRREQSPFHYQRNLLHFLLYLVFTPFIFLVETIKEISGRTHSVRPRFINKIDSRLEGTLDRIWYHLWGERISFLRSKNTNTYVSINRILGELPYTGLLILAGILVFVYLITRLGDNPATPQIDGYLVQFIEYLSLSLLGSIEEYYILFLVVILITVFITELINNMSTLLILFPLLVQIAASLQFNPIILLLAMTIGASSAFMSPVATSVNALAFGAVEGVSLKKMLRLGLALNLLGGLWLAVVFYLIQIIMVT
ncbi:MAG TPA: hypothetical protein EYP36_03960 [Calditrichaeota bacterium]|nr:hypothetical protein [Calditrichota bacterium]